MRAVCCGHAVGYAGWVVGGQWAGCAYAVHVECSSGAPRLAAVQVVRRGVDVRDETLVVGIHAAAHLVRVRVRVRVRARARARARVRVKGER